MEAPGTRGNDDARRSKRSRGGTILKKLSAVAAALAVSAFGAAPVSADNPEPFDDSFSFPDINPCTNELFFVTIDVVVSIHFHKNNFVLNIERSGTTSDGFVMHNGVETQHFNTVNAVAGFQFKDMWVNPETGQRFHVRGTSNVILGDGPDAPPTEVKVDNFSLRCVRS